jgi:hypothetical protein
VGVKGRAPETQHMKLSHIWRILLKCVLVNVKVCSALIVLGVKQNVDILRNLYEKKNVGLNK